MTFYANVSASSNYIKSPEFETECNDMINIHPYLEPAPIELPEPQALASSSSSFFSTQDVGSASTADVETRYVNRSDVKYRSFKGIFLGVVVMSS